VTGVTAGNNENFENLLKRFNKKVQQTGLLSDIKQGEFYEKPSAKRNRKIASNKRKSDKESRKSSK
jgi:small subunit ribosomal protein S21